MPIQAIHTEADYQQALQEVSALFDLDPAYDCCEGERLEVLCTLVQAYESQHYPIDLPDPIDAILFRMEQSGLSVQDLQPWIGPSDHVAQVLAGQRPLTLRMIRRLHAGLGISTEVLIRPSVRHIAKD